MALLAAVLVGLGLLVSYDGLTRPRGQSMPFDRNAFVRISGATFGGAAAFALTGWPVAGVAGIVLGFSVPRLLAEQRFFRRRIALTDALSEAAAGLRDAVRGGLGISEGISGLVAWGPVMLREEFARLSSEASRMGLAPAARRFADRIGDPGADLLAATLAFNERVGGGKVTEVLDAMAEELSGEAKTVRELRAGQARQRTSARIVALAPAVLLLILRQVNPAYLNAYNSAAGQGVLALAALLIGAGYVLMLRIGRGIEPPRVFLGDKR